jgi:hypothetical protein
MAYVECKICPFSDDINHDERRYKAMKEDHTHYTVKALIDTSSCEILLEKVCSINLDHKSL